MTSGGAPDSLNERHQLAAMLLAAGYRGSDVARYVGLSPNRLSIIKSQSPLFQAQIADLQRELRDAVKEDALAILERAAPGASRFLDELVQNDAAPLRERRQAATDILDRHPGLAKRAAPEASIHITFSAADLAVMKSAMVSTVAALPEGAEIPPSTHVEHVPRPTLVPLSQAGLPRDEIDDEV